MRRVPELDSLRALAMAVVVWLHAATLAGPLQVAPLMRWGWTAVDLFFVISGYLITTILLRGRPTAGFLANFHARRSLRIWPIYYLALAAFLAANLLLSHPFPTDGLPYYLTYTQNVPLTWGGVVPPFCKAFAHCWSLAVEEQFYLIWPAAVLIGGRKNLAPLCLVVMGLAVASRACGLDSQLLVTRCDGLAIGGLLAGLLFDEARVRKHASRLRLGLALTAAVGLGYLLVAEAFAFGPATRKPLDLLAINGIYAALVGSTVLASGHPALAALRSGRLIALGQISYGVYLYHNLLFALAQKAAGRDEPPAWLILAMIGLTLVVAAASWRFVERPFLALKDRFPSGESPAPARRPEVGLSRG